jgi:hypothetical protein
MFFFFFLGKSGLNSKKKEGSKEVVKHSLTLLLHGIGQKLNRISWLLLRFQGQLAHSAHTFLLSLIPVTIIF